MSARRARTSTAPAVSERDDARLLNRVAGTALNMIGRFGLITVLSALSTIAITRTFGPNRYGPYATGLATWMVLGAVSDFGLSMMLQRDAGRRGPPSRAMFRAAYETAFLWCLALTAAQVVMGFSAGATSTRGRVLLILAPGMLFNFINPARSVFLIAYRTGKLVLIDIGSGLLQVISILVLLVLGAGPAVIAAALSISSVINGVAVLWASEALLGPDEPRFGRRQIVRRAAPLGIVNVMTQVYFSIDLVLLGWLAHGPKVGEYAAASKLLTLLTSIQGMVVTSALPAMSREIAAGRDVRNLFARQWQWLLTGVVPVFVLTAIFAPTGVDVVFGHRYHGAALYLQILALAGVASVVSNISVYTQIALQRTRAIQVQNLLAIVINVAGNVALIPVVGVVAAAWMTLGTEVLLAAAATVSIRDRIDLRVVSRQSGRAGLALLGAIAIGELLHSTPILATALAAVTFVVSVTALRGWPPEFATVIVRLRQLRTPTATN